MMRLLDKPFSTFIGEGFCRDGLGLTDFSKFSCSCDASASATSCLCWVESPATCASNCWDLQENHLNPLLAEFHDRSGYTNIIINMVGYQFTENSLCECLLDTDFLDADEATTLELTDRMFDLAESTGNELIAQGSEHFMNVGSISSSFGSGLYCYAFDNEGSSCTDQIGYFDKDGDGCDWYKDNANACSSCYIFRNRQGVSPCDACCICGGQSNNPTVTRAPTPSPTPFQPTPWRAYDEDKTDGGTVEGIAVFGVFIVIFFIMACFFMRQKARRQAAAANAPQPSAPTEGSNNNAQTQLQQQERFEAKLAATSMIVAKKDIVAKEPTVRKLDSDDNNANGTAGTETEEQDIVVPPALDIEVGDNNDDYDDDHDVNNNDESAFAESMRMDSESNWMLQLPTGQKIWCHCAICLSSYKVGDKVSWATSSGQEESTESKCQHAFHTSCIVKYAETSSRNSNSTDVPCPMCRQPFISTQRVES